METSYVFGPVPSRRLGRSLGVDPVPFKTCNWNCIYCQLGRTGPLARERSTWVPSEAVVSQVEAAVRRLGRAVDWVTFAGSGEPTLHDGIGWMIRRIQERTSIPVAVITNGSLLDRADVREDLLAADAVLPTLDAGRESLYRRVNRPASGFSFANLVEGLVRFRAEYRGRLWVEVMLVRGVNDSAAALEDLAGVLARVRPDAIHLNLPSRPPAEPSVAPAEAEALMLATAVLGREATVVSAATVPLAFAPGEDPVEAVVAAVQRHPMRESEILAALGGEGDLARARSELEPGGRLRAVERGGERFWTSPRARYRG